ncbi:vitellogenin-2-like isoform X2 [Lucilia sericata]|uniref:vitellogenin-2-like isoform X1 n=1 Tax=Lucilia sericata TaxID=13632 RepID=UPI0018A817EE|nr:vitellogenin-2-like isoform X1 [Lucilia sericata]XP_037822784.1 vitellogenin-2-like isoform X2 [Lucilia sericata]
MSSSQEINKESKESLDNSGLSLFDQLKNSKDHNSVNKVATLKTSKTLEDIPKHEIIDNTAENFNKIPITTSSSSSSLVSALEKPEFYPPSLPASQSSLLSSCGLGIVASNKRHNSQTNLFNSRDFQTLPQSLKRSQQNATKKSALSSSSKVLGNLLSSTSLTSLSSSTSSSASSSLSSLAAGVAAAALLKPACLAGDQTHLHHNHHHHQHHLQQQQHNKKKRCTDRYDSSESSDR